MITPTRAIKQVKKNTKQLKEIDPRQGRVFERVVRDSSLLASASAASASSVRLAYPVNDAGSGSTISCRLDNVLTGDIVTVSCSIFGGSDLSEASPLLNNDGNPIFVSSISGQFWCISPFDIVEECGCTAP